MQFLGKLDQNGTETYGFKTNKYLPAIEELNEFESDLVSMIKISNLDCQKYFPS